jgi:hypothetical protein
MAGFCVQEEKKGFASDNDFLDPAGNNLVLIDHLQNNQHVLLINCIFVSDGTCNYVTGMDKASRVLFEAAFSLFWDLDYIQRKQSSVKDTGQAKLASLG